MSENTSQEIKPKKLYLFTRTPLHVGAGASVGAMDQPVQRERHTGFPIIPGSTIKGVLADHFLTSDRKNRTDLGRQIFGHEITTDKAATAGKLAFGEAKVLAFPVRSARGSFAFITCPLALERFHRVHHELNLSPLTEPKEMTCLTGSAVKITRPGETGVVLEEYKYSDKGVFPPDWEQALLSLIDDPVWQVAKDRLVLLSNGDFSHFVRTACEINQHVAINDITGTSIGGALFDLEAVPAETLFFASITPLLPSGEAMEGLSNFLNGKRILQFGGDGSTGLGFCSVKLA